MSGTAKATQKALRERIDSLERRLQTQTPPLPQSAYPPDYYNDRYYAPPPPTVYYDAPGYYAGYPYARSYAKYVPNMAYPASRIVAGSGCAFVQCGAVRSAMAHRSRH